MIVAMAKTMKLSLQILVFVHDLPMLRGGWGRRGAGLLRPSDGRDKIAPLL